MHSFLRPFDQYITALIAVGITCAGALTFFSTKAPDFDLRSLGDGSWQSSYEAAFDDVNVVKSEAVHAYNALQIMLAGQIQSDVVIGSDKWLFSETEYKLNPSFSDTLAQNISTVASVVADLQSRGIDVKVVALPDKARVMADYAPSNRGALVDGRYTSLVDGLTAKGVTVISPLDHLISATSRDPMFLRSDTHWTPEGAIKVAKLVAANTGEKGSVSKTLTRVGEREHVGDLYRFLDLGRYREWLNFEYETVSEYALGSGSASLEADLFGASTVDGAIHLVGTSYSEDVRWSFADAIEVQSGRPVVNFAQKGYGPLKPMFDYLDQLTANSDLPDIIIWEIPEKYMSLVPSEMGERGDA